MGAVALAPCMPHAGMFHKFVRQPSLMNTQGEGPLPGLLHKGVLAHTLPFFCLFRKTPTQCLYIALVKPDDPLAPLLLPGAELALAALRIYAGPKGAHIRCVVAAVVVVGCMHALGLTATHLSQPVSPQSDSSWWRAAHRMTSTGRRPHTLADVGPADVPVQRACDKPSFSRLLLRQRHRPGRLDASLVGAQQQARLGEGSGH